MASVSLLPDEQLVLHRHYNSLLPTLLIILGAILSVVGLIVMILTMIPAFLIGILLVAVGAILTQSSGIDLVVTDKRIYLDGPFSNFVSLPLSHISNVTTHSNAIHIFALGGHISISGVQDIRVVRNTIISLLNQLQPPLAGEVCTETVPAPQTQPSVSKAPTPKPKSTLNAYFSSYKSTKTAPSKTADTSGPAEWTCTCGKVNPPYMSSCSCGKTAREIREMNKTQ